MNSSESPDRAEQLEVCIVGAGFSGMGMAIKLKQAGQHSFAVLEQGDSIGGTWRDNTYPGCACDIPSHLYSFSFALNPGWTRTFPTQPEIWAYMRRVSDHFQLSPHLRLKTRLEEARWEPDAKRWHLKTDSGRSLHARFLVVATGGLSRPAFPSLEGLERFGGPSFHSARWDHGVSLRGQRVAVIGTGASAIQFVPRIAPEVRSLTLYQRTAPWIVPRDDREFSSFRKWLFRWAPGYMRLHRARLYFMQELLGLAFTWFPSWMRLGERMALKHLHAQISDPTLRAQVTPTYTMGCKRVLISNDYYPALTRPGVEVVDTPIRSIEPQSIIDEMGNSRPTDVLIFGTGFHVTDYPGPIPIYGRDGIELRSNWQQCAEAYLGTMVSGFPNLFTMTGPNTGLGHNSIIFMIEAQLRLIMSALEQMRARGISTIEPRAELQAAYSRALQARTSRTVWLTGCRSWYLSPDGLNHTLWPGLSASFWSRTRRARLEDYLLDAPAYQS